MIKLPKPSRSILQCGMAAIATVLLLSWLRPLGVIFLGVLSYWLYWTRCSFRIVLTPEVRQRIDKLLQHISDWRRTSPTMFCTVSCGCLGTLAILGHLLSGSSLVLALLVLSALLSTKYNFKLLKIEHKDFHWSEKLSYNTEAELDDEFMPDVNESNLFVLERASDVATISSPADADDEEERSDEIPSELLIPDAIPEIDEHSTDEDDELVPFENRQKQIAAAVAAQEMPGTAEAKSGNSIEFRKGHFKRDSSLSTTSSSSEESFANELVALAVKTQTQALLASGSKLLPSLVSGLVQWSAGTSNNSTDLVDTTDAAAEPAQAQKQQQRRIVTALDSSDESDFEILETDDFK